MSGPEDVLAEIERLIATVRMQEAETRAKSLIDAMGDTELKIWESDLRASIDGFYKKRKRALLSALDARLSVGHDLSASQSGRPSPNEDSEQVERPEAYIASAPLGSGPDWPIIETLQTALDDLSDYHIFQWNTFYRDDISQFFARYIAQSSPTDYLRSSALRVRAAICRHAREIYSKGYFHASGREGSSVAIEKSLSGLQRFLDLPIEFYSNRLLTPLTQVEALRARAVTSAITFGILEGYSQVSFGTADGRSLLSESPGVWAHVLAFLTVPDATDLPQILGVDPLSEAICVAVPPIAAALDDLIVQSSEYVPLPTLSQFIKGARRLEVRLRTPQVDSGGAPVELHCYFDRAVVTDSAISESLGRGIAALVTPLRPDLRSVVGTHEAMDRVLVPILQHDFSTDSARRRILGLLITALYRERSPSASTEPILYNFAREFPLNNPFLTRYYHVHRPSVRSLLRTFERRNGVRLWCSVRRSGKTTAGMDLGSTSGESRVISQTCDDTGQLQNGAMLYNQVCAALDTGKQLPQGFLEESLAASGDMSMGDSQRRTVLVLDEYETLFGRLSTSAAHDPGLRYTVAQPLLNQMVAFARDNLLILMGQQPTAHYIMMDQNQLSAYVEQDHFPLFSSHASGGASEFNELLTRILTQRVTFDSSFSNRVFLETAGHPFLTANLMAEFVDWLISTKRPARSLTLDASDVSSFARVRLRRSYIGTAHEYRFFRAAIGQALSPAGRRSTPWLHAIYSCLREVGSNSPETFSTSREDFDQICEKIDVRSLGLTPELLLTTGEQANFLAFSDRYVNGKIRMLTRLATVAPIGFGG